MSEMLPKPYYDHNGITIYHGDCREILPHLPKVDLVLTDPPYGINENHKKAASRGKLAKPRDYGVFNWDKEPIPEWLLLQIRDKADKVIVWGGNYYPLPPAKCWLVWDKKNGTNDFADCELAWTNLPKAVRRIEHLWNGMLRKNCEDRFHPTQKPIEVITWAAQQTEWETCLDPFMGSGTTLRAAKDLGRKAIGIEIEEKYCEIAAERLEQEVFNFNA